MGLTSLPELPQGLTELDAGSNQLTSLPELPQGLTELDAGSNQLTSLPELPQALSSLGVYCNRLTSLPELPQGLKTLSAHSNQLTSLPKLPQGLIQLIVFKNQLTSLPELPESLIWIKAFNNRLASLPKLPQGRVNLWLHGNLQINIPADLIVGTHYGCTNAVRQWQSNHPDLVDQSAAAPAIPAVLPATTLDEHHPDHAATTTSPFQQPSFTHAENRRIAALLAANTTPPQLAFTPEQHATLTALAMLEQNIIDAVTRQPLVMKGETPSPEEMDKLIHFLQIKFADDSKKQQWAAEVGALKTVYPTTAEGGQKLYNLLFKALIALSNNTAQDVSGIDGANHGMVSTGAAGLKTMAGLFGLVPLGGNQVAEGAKGVIGAIDSRRMASGLLKGLDAAETVGNDGTLLQREATMHRMAHALSYRLAMHHCEKKNSPGGASGQQSGNAVGTSDIPVAAFQSYTHKIFAAFMQPEKTFADNDPDLAVTSLLTVALTKVAGSIRDRSPARALEIAQELGKKHQQIIDTLMRPAGPAAVPVAAGTGATPQSGQLPGTSTPTPDAARQAGVHELTAQMAQMAQQFAALNSQQQALTAQHEEDRRNVQMLQNQNQELMALLAQTNQRFAAMESDNHTLRTELQTLSNKPVDPMIGVLNHAVDGLNTQLASLQTNLNLTHRSAASAHAELHTLTPQLLSLHGALASLKEDVNTLQASLDDTPEKAAVVELGDQVAGLVQDKQRADADLRKLKRTVSTLEQETGVGTSSDGSLIAALMPPPRQGRLAQGQDIQIAELTARADDHAQRIGALQGIAGITQMSPPAPGPNEDNNRRKLFANLWNREGRR